jgi:hypothetical protein
VGSVRDGLEGVWMPYITLQKDGGTSEVT